MKKINQKKINRAKSLLKEGYTFAHIRNILKEEFNEAIGPNELCLLRKEVLSPKIKKDEVISVEIMTAIQILLNLFDDAVKIPKFMALCSDKQFDSVDLLGELIGVED